MISDADLIAYLDNPKNKAMSKSIQNSLELQTRLKAVQDSERQLTALFGHIDKPDDQDLVDYVAGQADANTRLRVAAYLRVSLTGQRKIAELEKEWAKINAPARVTRIRLPKFFAVPLNLALETRAAASTTSEYGFFHSELSVKILYRITPPVRDQWGIRGVVLQNEQPTPNLSVRLHSVTKRVRQTMTDDMGHFHFERVNEGVYWLQVKLEKGFLEAEKFELIV